MKTQAYLPFPDNKRLLVKKGDVIELITREKATFIEMKRTKWHGSIDGRLTVIPVYRNSHSFLPYQKAIVGTDKSVIAKVVKPTTFKFGDLFFLEGHKETFMFFSTETNRSGKKIVNGKDLASGKMYSIGYTMPMVGINVNKIKRENKPVNA